MAGGAGNVSALAHAKVLGDYGRAQRLGRDRPGWHSVQHLVGVGVRSQESGFSIRDRAFGYRLCRGRACPTLVGGRQAAPLLSLCENVIQTVIPIPQSRERNLALSIFNAVAHARPLTGTRKPRKCANRLGVRRLDATFAPRERNTVLSCAAAAPKFQGGVKPPHSKVPSAQA